MGRGDGLQQIEHVRGLLRQQDVDPYQQLQPLSEQAFFFAEEEEPQRVHIYRTLPSDLALQPGQLLTDISSNTYSLRTTLQEITLKDGRQALLQQKFVVDGFGADDYEHPDGLPIQLEATVESIPAAHLSAYLDTTEGHRIHFLSVEVEFQRQGLATQMLRAFESEWGEWVTNDTTDEGGLFLDNYYQHSN